MRASTGVPQRVLIVGGSSEIGASLARAWLNRGTRGFVLTERVEGRAADLARDLEEGGATVTTVVLDALDPESLARSIEEAWGDRDIDLAVVAIGLLSSQQEIEEHPTLVRDVLTVNATSTIEVALHAANRMAEQQYGTMVLLSSVAGQRGRRDNYVYGASKAALDTFAEGLQQRFADSSIKVLVVRPGYVYSKMSAGVNPAPFAVTVEESTGQIVRAVEREREVVWIPSVLASIFYVSRLLPRRLWAAVVSRVR